MKAIKEFLKPNRWEIIIFLIILISLFSSLEGFISDNILFCGIPEGCPPSSEEGKIKLLDTYLNPNILRVVLYISSYLLACFIYFIIKKTKRLIGK